MSNKYSTHIADKYLSGAIVNDDEEERRTLADHWEDPLCQYGRRHERPVRSIGGNPLEVVS